MRKTLTAQTNTHAVINLLNIRVGQIQGCDPQVSHGDTFVGSLHMNTP